MLRVQSVFVIFVITSSVLTVCNGDVKNEWVEPDAFSRRRSSSVKQTITSSSDICECDSCPVCPESNAEPQVCMKPEDDISTVLYKRLVSSLIIKDTLRSKSSTKIMRMIVTEKHLKILESSNNIRDWDGVMSEIIGTLERIDPDTNYVYKEGSNFSFNFNLSSVAMFLSRSEVQFTLVVILCLSTAVYLHKRFRWGLIWMFGVALFSFGYLYTYYECNRQLEVDEIVNMMHTEHNPCKEIDKPKSFFNSFFRIFSNPKEECEQYLRKKHQIKISFCRPDDVWVKYLNNIMFNQIEALVKKSIDIFQRTSREVPWPYNIVAMVAIPFLVWGLIKLVFQYILSPQVWFAYYNRPTVTSHPPTSRAERIEGGISQENLRAVLDTIQAVTLTRQTESITHVRAVLDQIQTVSSIRQTESVPQINMIEAPSIPMSSIRQTESVPQVTMIEAPSILISSIGQTESIPQVNIIEPPSTPIKSMSPIPMKRKLNKQMSGVELLNDPDQNEEDSGTVSNESGISNESCDKIKAS